MPTLSCSSRSPRQVPGWARFASGDSRVTRIRLAGLSTGNLTELASALRLGVLSQRGASQLAAHTGGNALYCPAVLGQHAPVSAIVSVARLPDAWNEVDAAVAAGLLTDGGPALELAFAHPLYRAAIYADLSPASRRELHARAGEVVARVAGLAHRAAAPGGPAAEALRPPCQHVPAPVPARCAAQPARRHRRSHLRHHRCSSAYSRTIRFSTEACSCLES